MLRYRSVLVLYALLSSFTVSAQSGSDASMVFSQVRQLHATGNFQQAEALLKEALSMSAQNQKLALYYGLNLRYQNRFGEAKVELQRTIAINRESWDAQQAMFLLAKVQGLAGEKAGALATQSTR